MAKKNAVVATEPTKAEAVADAPVAAPATESKGKKKKERIDLSETPFVIASGKVIKGVFPSKAAALKSIESIGRIPKKGLFLGTFTKINVKTQIVIDTDE